MIERQNYHVIGMMSGTSLDGIDIVDVFFTKNDNGKWNFQLNNCELYEFEQSLLEKLKIAFKLPAEELTELSSSLGRFYGEIANQFIADKKIRKHEIDFIASHGQTIFHRPDLGYTLQIGNGPELTVITGIPSVTDFRTKDVVLGGNGAPLIPVADFLLFSNYADSFLNLGGFSNYSFKKENEVYSYDICPVNIVINHLVKEINLDYDKNGKFGATGNVDNLLLNRLNQLEFYHTKGPKSLGWEWVETEILPLLKIDLELNDIVRTFYEHIAYQIGNTFNQSGSNSVLITGGGAKNTFLIDRIKSHSNCEIILPKTEIIDFKEAIGFGFLGLLRWRNETNIWASVTGSKRDSSSGIIYRP